MVIGNFVEPFLFGESFELSPVVVLLSLAFWGSLWVSRVVTHPATYITQLGLIT